MKPDVNPEEYVKLFNIKESLFTGYYEVVERERMEKDGYPNIEMIYIDTQHFYMKEDLEKYDLPDDRIEENLAQIEERAKEYISFTESVDANAPWEGQFEAFARAWGRYLRVLDVPIYVSMHLEPKVLQMMLDAGFTEKEFDILTHPLYNTYHQRRHRDLILLKKGDMTREEFKERWKWSGMTLFRYSEIDDAFIGDHLTEMGDPAKEFERLRKQHEEAEQEYKDLYSRLPEDLQRKADLIQGFLRIRDWRFEQIIRGAYNMLPFHRRVAEELGITYDELIHMLPEEILRKDIPEDLHARMEAYVLRRGKVYTGSVVKEWRDLFNKPSQETSVKGKGVAKGNVTGTAKIVNRVDELDKIEKGDIIVCDITTPDYMHALHKVSAIVANIGGFTSHSAIVAREFGIPCVVGCGNATLTFKDNDTIEVDADKGVVRKI